MGEYKLGDTLHRPLAIDESGWILEYESITLSIEIFTEFCNRNEEEFIKFVTEKVNKKNKK